MGKYDPLRDHLASLPEDVHELTMSFGEIGELVGGLPQSARKYQAWWANTDDSRVQAQAWRAAGWYVQLADRASERVVFVRGNTGAIAAAVRHPSSARLAETSKQRATDLGNPIPGRADASSGTSPAERIGLRKSVTLRALIGDFAIGAVAAAVAGVSGLVGLTHLPWLALLLLSTTIGAVAFTITQAIVSRNHADSALWWWSISTTLLLVIAAGTFTYHKMFDPATRAARTYQFVVNGNEINVIPLYGEAGGPAQLLATGVAGQNGLVGGQSYSFDCWTIGLNDAEWLRYERFGQTWWAPRRYLHPPFGEPEPPIPHC